jgi:hypothetical protein
VIDDIKRDTAVGNDALVVGGGCGCHTHPLTAPWWLLLSLLLLISLRRRS